MIIFPVTCENKSVTVPLHAGAPVGMLTIIRIDCNILEISDISNEPDTTAPLEKMGRPELASWSALRNNVQGPYAFV